METHTIIRPSITERQVSEIAEKMYGLRVLIIKELPSYVDRNFLLTVSRQCDMAHREHTFILKVTNNEHFHNQEELFVQHAAMAALKTHSFACTQVLKNLYDDEISSFDFPDALQDGQKRTCAVRLMTYIPGTNLLDCIDHVNKQILYEIGQLLGKLHKTLKTLTCSLDADDRENPWRIENVMQLRMYLKPMDSRNKLLLTIIHAVQEHALKQSSLFAKGIIHGDIHDMNIIVNFKDGKFQPLFSTESSDASSPMSKYGIIDFGDLTHSSYVFEVAMAIADFMVDCDSVTFWDIGAHILAGYLTVEKITEVEFSALYYVIAARYCQYIVLGEHTHQIQPDNDYIKLSSDESWEKIQILWNSNITDVYATWNRILRVEYKIDCYKF